jgi:hypothetical protein
MLVIHHRDGFHHAGNVHLMPGVNDVDEKEFAEVSKYEAFKALLDDGTIEVLQSKDGKPLALADVAKLPEKKAMELVDKTVSKPVLKAMRDADKRPAVVEAIEEQLAVIDPSKK